MQSLRTGPASLRDYLRLFWQRKWIVLAVVVTCTLFAFVWSWRQTPQYAATSTLIYQKDLDVANPLTGWSYTDPNERNLELQSVADVIASGDIGDLAAATLAKRGFGTAGYAVVAESSGDPNQGVYRNTVTVTGTSSDPVLAAEAANAYADTYIIWRKQQILAQIGQAIQAVQRKLDTYLRSEQASTDYIILQQRLSDLEILKATTAGNYRVLARAVAPTAPYAPKPLRSAALGLSLSVFAAAGLVLLLDQLDTRMRDAETVAELLESPILARIPSIPKREIAADRLVCLSHPEGHAAEAFRVLRTNLDFMSVDREVRSLAVTSCVQGEGKSVTLANLAIALAVASKRVVVIDGDLRRPQMHGFFGLKNDIGVSTVVTGQTTLAESLQSFAPAVGAETASALRGPDGLGSVAGMDRDVSLDIRVLTSGPLPPNPGEIAASRVFGDIITTLTDDADIVLVDSPAMLAVGDTVALCSRVDGFLFLVRLDAVHRPQLERAAEQFSRMPCRLLGLVVARGKVDSSAYYYYGYSRDGAHQLITEPPLAPSP
jgi:polysaccharide biosynthesis transport protein